MSRSAPLKLRASFVVGLLLVPACTSSNAGQDVARAGTMLSSVDLESGPTTTTGPTATAVGPTIKRPPLNIDALRPLDIAISLRQFGKARGLAAAIEEAFEPDERLKQRLRAIEVYQLQLDESVPWHGTVAHLFTHSLIFHPEDAFDGDRQEPGYQENMLTATEFERIIEAMYEGGWILVDVHDLFEEQADGTLEATPILVPPGRKPFVLSIDDVSYYDYMTGNGFAERLDIDPDLNVATVFRQDDDSEVWSLAGDVVPILDQFIWENPDFSSLGAKGILALTGYEGILGYDVSRDQVQHPEFAERQAKAHEVADRLRELGWQFASHSYTHHGDMRDRTMSFSRFQFDAENWRKEVGEYVGETDLYVSPYGYHMRDSDSFYRFLVEEEGFNVYCPISDGTTVVMNADNMVSERRSLDGYALLHYGDELRPYFDVTAIWDESRGRIYPSEPNGHPSQSG